MAPPRKPKPSLRPQTKTAYTDPIDPATGIPAPPPPPKPKPKKTGPPAQTAAIDALLKYAPKWRAYLPGITNAAARWGVDPAQLLALLIFENGGAKNKEPGSISTAGAAGLAQILDRNVDRSLNPEQYATFVAQFGGQISREKAEDPSFALNYAAWRMAGGLRAYGGNLNAWYNGAGGAGKPRGYNPGFTGDSRGKGPEAIFRLAGVTRYQPTIPQAPSQAAGKDVEKDIAKQALTDPWVVIKKGKVTYAPLSTIDPPKNALIVDGLPITRSVFLGQRRQLEETYISYTGKRPTNEQVANFLNKGWSVYTLQNVLSKTKDFLKSPVYKSVAPGYQASAEGLLAPGERLDPDLIRQAVINRWDGDTFQAQLRKRPGYVKSTEFTGKVDGFSNVYMTIYGVPDDVQEMAAIREAALGGWSLDQFAGWLRGRPEYTRSSEYQTKMVTFLDRLGLITGGVATLKPGQAPKNTMPQLSGALPNDPRIAGRGGIDPDNQLVAAYGAG